MCDAQVLGLEFMPKPADIEDREKRVAAGYQAGRKAEAHEDRRGTGNL